jgi:hypothetical protein
MPLHVQHFCPADDSRVEQSRQQQQQNGGEVFRTDHILHRGAALVQIYITVHKRQESKNIRVNPEAPGRVTNPSSDATTRPKWKSIPGHQWCDWRGGCARTLELARKGLATGRLRGGCATMLQK